MPIHNGIVRSGSADIHYQLYINNKPKTLVLLHGNGESIARFEKHIPILSEYYDLLLIDSRGHGQSTMGDGELSLSKSAVDLENVLEHLQLKKVHLLGFSDGANTAMLFAPKNNDKIEKLILVGGNLNFKGLTLSTRILVAFGYYISYLSMKADKSRRIDYAYYYLMYKEPNIQPNEINKIQAPTLVLAGKKDMITRAHTDLICNSIKKGMLKLYDGDHFYIYREPEAFCKIIIDYLEE